MNQNHQPINLKEKLALFEQQWQPHIVAKLNDYEFKLVKVNGEFIWHQHKETDEAFMVISGELHIALQEGDVSIKAGELFVVPKGIEHKPYANEECHLLLIEPQDIPNTGDKGGERTGKLGLWI